MKRNCLKRADELLDGERRHDYGDAVEMAHRVAHAWTAIVGHTVTAEQYALMMAALKVVRESVSPKADNLDDGCAYLRIAEMVRERKSFD